MEDIRTLLQANGFTFKKKYGQNFLTDANLLRAIVSDAGVDGETTVLEIGPGAGTLTRALAGRAKRVVAYEIDERLRPVLRQTLAEFPNAEVRFLDFAGVDLPALERELGRYVVVANLPYYITTPLVMRFVEEAALCDGVTVMVQEEVAERFCAEAGTPEYGAVTAAIARRGRASVTRRVPRTLFYPRPNVDSAVVRIDLSGGGIPVKSEKVYRDTVRCAFLNRRKTLENNLMQTFRLSREEAAELLSALAVGEKARGETLTPQQLARLSDLLFVRGVR